MQKSTLIIYAGLIGTLLSAGCAKQQQFNAVEQICIPQIDKAQAMQSAEKVLSKMNFVIDKADAEQGIIKTRPLTAAQFFEFWRKDNVGSFNTAEANLQTIRRTAELNITQQTDKLCINCNVNVQRLNMAQQDSSIPNTCGTVLQTKSYTSKLRLDAEQRKNVAWVDLGRDGRLETEILKRLEKQIAKLQKGKAI